MKKTKFKRVLSGFLALLMLLTMAPVTAFSATDAELKNLKTAIGNYESKMDGTILTNMETAYKAYIKAKQYADSYEYGSNTGLVLTDVTDELKTATDNMQTWMPSQGTANTLTFNADSATYPATSTYCKNLLYINNVAKYEGNGAVFKSDDNWMETRVYYDITVMLYDGITTPSLPIMMSIKTSYNGKYVYSAYPCFSGTNAESSKADNAYFSLPGKWYGETLTTADFPTIRSTQPQVVGFNNATITSASVGPYNTSNAYTYFANFLQFTGGDTWFSDGSYSKSLALPWYTAAADKVDDAVSTSKTKPWTASKSIYVVNYKALLNEIISKRDALSNVKNYADTDEAGMVTFLQKIDAATTFDPNTYFTDTTSSNAAANVTSCASAISAQVTTIKNLTAPTAADDAYDALRTALSTKTSDGADIRLLYKTNNSRDIFTDGSWAIFSAAFEAAQNEINIVLTNGYTGTNVSAIASNLTAAVNGLTKTVELADSSYLRTEIILANKILDYSEYVVGAEALQTAVDAGLNTFWDCDINDLTKYPLTQQAALDEITLAIITALSNISLLDTERLEAGINTLNDIVPTTVVDPKARLASLTKARLTLDEIKKTTIDAENVASVVEDYVSACEAIEEAIVYARTPYKMQEDAILSAGSGASTISYNLNNQYNNTATFTYPKDIVLIKATSDETVYPSIGDYKFKLDASVDKWHNHAQKIYELGITNDTYSNNTANTVYEPFTKGQLKLNQFELTGFDGDVGSSDLNGEMVGSPASVNVGLTDGSTGTYWYAMQSSYERTSPVAFTAPALDENEVPTIQTYSASRSYIYAYSKRATSINWLGNQNNFAEETTTISVDTPMNVTVVDISSLCQMYDEANAIIIKNNACGLKYYTSETYQAFLASTTDAKTLSNENAAINYNGTMAEYIAACGEAFTTLHTAINNLELIEYTVTFNYKDKNGQDTSTSVTGNYDDMPIPPSPPNYIDGDYELIFDNWDPTVSTITGNAAYTALYTQIFIPADYSALDAIMSNVNAVIKAGRHEYYEINNYNAMRELYNTVLSTAYDDGEYTFGITQQAGINTYTSSLLEAYNALHAKNYFTVTFKVYVDDNFYAELYSGLYEVKSTAELPVPSECQGYATWYVNGVEQKNVAGYSYSFIVTRDTKVECKLVSGGIDDATKVIIQTASGQTYKEYYVGPETSITELIAEAEAPTAAYYKHIGWTINGKNPDALIESLGDVVQRVGKEVKLRPKYELTSVGYTFDENNTVTSSATDFLCWVLKVDDNTYRVVSYSKSYTYYTTGKYAPEAVTGANFSTFDGKLQDVTRDMIDAKMPIPSMRGIEEDLTSANGAYWDKDTKQLRIISQFTEGYDKSKYTIVDCGVKFARVDGVGSTITTAVGRTTSEQYIVYYSFNSWIDANTRTYSAQSWVTYEVKSTGKTVTVYSPEAQFTLSL